MSARCLKLALLSVLLAGCATAPAPPLVPERGPFGPEQSFTGILALGIERESFDDCWLEFRGSSRADLARLAPSPALANTMAFYAADVTLAGRRRDMLNLGSHDIQGRGFGHLGIYPCLIETTRIIAAHAR